MKKYIYLFVAAGLMGSLTGCLDKYQDLNTDTELLNNVDPRNAFTGATQNFNNCSRAHLTSLYGGTMVYMQYTVPSGGPSENYYISLSKNGRTEPGSYAYWQYYQTITDNYGAFGLRLNYLINNVIPTQNESERYNDVKAISQILLNYEQWRMLDTYGAAPITEAFKAQTEGIRTPRYDLYQKAVDGTPMYKKIDAEVKAAVELLKASDDNQYDLGSNDFFFSGDVEKWIKFGNTLRVKMAQRLELADAAFYNSVINEVLTSADNVMGSNEESCIYYHPNDYNNNTDDIQGITSNYCASRAFVNFLKAYNDPRLPVLVRPNGFGEKNNNAQNDAVFATFKEQVPDWESHPDFVKFGERYIGMSANPDSANSTYSMDRYLDYTYKDGETEKTIQIRMNSQVEGRYFVKNGGRNGNNNMPARDIEAIEYEVNQDKIDCFTPLITYPETCFMLAEIAIKKGSAVAGKDATAWYREGIKASLEQYMKWAENMYVVAQVAEGSAMYNPITAAKIDTYLARTEFQTATLEKIISQQWINLYRQPEEMWATWKRTGLPAFKNQPDPESGVAFLERIQNTQEDLVIPRRNSLPTPNSENLQNYNEAVKALCEDANYGTGYDRTEGRIWWDKKQ